MRKREEKSNQIAIEHTETTERHNTKVNAMSFRVSVPCKSEELA